MTRIYIDFQLVIYYLTLVISMINILLSREMKLAPIYHSTL